MHTKYLPQLEERFVRYVQIDTMADDTSPTSPSTAKQYDLINVLADELRAIGASDVRVTDYGAVLATVPGRGPNAGTAPTVAFLAHVDTIPGFSGAGVKPQVHRAYDGGALPLFASDFGQPGQEDRLRHRHRQRHDDPGRGRQVRRSHRHGHGR